MLKFLGSFKLTTALFILIIFQLAIGSIIPQNSCENIGNSNLAFVIKFIIINLQLCNIFVSPLFFITSLFLIINLTIYLIDIKNYKNLEPTKEYIFNRDIREELLKLNYKLVENNGNIQAKKGEIYKYSTFFIHISIYFIILGGIITYLFTFKSYVELTPQNIISFENIYNKAYVKSRLINIKQNWEIKLNKFWIEYYNHNHVKQFYSYITILENNKQTTYTISVNNPINYKGYKIYQSSWNIIGIKFLINNKEALLIPDYIPKKGYFIKSKELKDIVIHFKSINDNNFYVIFDSKKRLVSKKDKFKIKHLELKYIEPVFSTGLLIKKDLGLPFIYIGYLLLMIGVFLNLLTYRVINIEKVGENKYKLIGYSNKGNYSISKELEKILQR